MSALAIIPARAGSKGVPNKNFRPLAGEEWLSSPLMRAVRCAEKAGLRDVCVTSDTGPRGLWLGSWLQRPSELAQDDTPMIDVVKHVLEQIPGPPDQKIVLLQPTQPLRKPEHITKALELLTPEVDSVVSVVELPQTHAAEFQLRIAGDGELVSIEGSRWEFPNRQDVPPVYIREGTVYAFWRRTVMETGNIYGQPVAPLIIPPNETCPLDTEADWQEAERRLREREHISDGDSCPGRVV